MSYILVDSNYIGTSSFHAIGEMYHDDLPVGVIYGFIDKIIQCMKTHKTHKLIFCFDSDKSYRIMKRPDYKKVRRDKLTEQDKEDRETIFFQLGQLREYILSEIGFKNIFHQYGYEGDDMIAYATKKFTDENFLIYSADEDLWQLLDGDRVEWYSPAKNGKYFMTEDKFREMHGDLSPVIFARIKAMAGKPSEFDGIKGIGRKKAVEYYAKTMKTTSKAYQNIKENKHIAKMNLPICVLPYRNPDAPISFEIEKQPKLDVKAFMRILAEYGLDKLVDERIIKGWKSVIRGMY